MLASLSSAMFGWSNHPLKRYPYRDGYCCLMYGITLCPVVCLWNVFPLALILLKIHIEYYCKIVSGMMPTSQHNHLKVLSFLPDDKSLSGVATLASNAETRFPQVFLVVVLFRRPNYSSRFSLPHHFMANPSCFLSTPWLLIWRFSYLLCPCGELFWFPLR